jgi:hypothetical protein
MNDDGAANDATGSSLCNARAVRLFGTTMNKKYRWPVNICSKVTTGDGAALCVLLKTG